MEDDFFDIAKAHMENRSLNTLAQTFVKEGPNIVIHLIPSNFLSGRPNRNFKEIDKNNLKPICRHTTSLKSESCIISFGGLNFNGKHGCCTELRENGVVEAVDTTILKNNNLLPFHLFIAKISNSLKQYFNILFNDLKIKTPIFFSLVLNNVEEYKIVYKNGERRQIIKNKLDYSTLIEDYSEIEDLLEKLFKRILEDSY